MPSRGDELLLWWQPGENNTFRGIYRGPEYIIGTRLGLKCQTPVKVKPLPLPIVVSEKNVGSEKEKSLFAASPKLVKGLKVDIRRL